MAQNKFIRFLVFSSSFFSSFFVNVYTICICSPLTSDAEPSPECCLPAEMKCQLAQHTNKSMTKSFLINRKSIENISQISLLFCMARASIFMFGHHRENEEKRQVKNPVQSQII